MRLHRIGALGIHLHYIGASLGVETSSNPAEALDLRQVGAVARFLHERGSRSRRGIVSASEPLFDNLAEIPEE
ncbi:MAG TPA: hypothetical protein VLT59_01695 [Steroidobacteraceae bacterium]|nr:hypothetical protein [Steroidobacteraceae bacterium]